MKKLKPCPFCGGKVFLKTYGDFSGLSPDVCCKNDTCRAFMRCRNDSDIPELIKRWNRRPK